MQINKSTHKPHKEQKQIFLYILLIATLTLIFLPFMTTFNDLLTRLVMHLDIYKFIQRKIVPWQVRMVGVLLYPFGFQPHLVGDYLSVGEEQPLLVEIAWNCVGWQSLLFFLLTAWVGLQGSRYSLISKIKAWIIGFLGTFLVNLIRIVFIVLLAYYFGQNIAIVFHDYGAVIMTILWLFVFWWFSYSYVLEEK